MTVKLIIGLRNRVFTYGLVPLQRTRLYRRILKLALPKIEIIEVDSINASIIFKRICKGDSLNFKLTVEPINLIAKSGRMILGIIVASRRVYRSEPVYEALHLYVRPLFRGLGIAEKLGKALETKLECADEKKVNALIVTISTSNRPMIQMARKKGYPLFSSPLNETESPSREVLEKIRVKSPRFTTKTNPNYTLYMRYSLPNRSKKAK